MAFDKQAFNVRLNEACETLSQSEKVSKAILSELSRSLLENLHFDADIQSVNRVLNVCSPMNRRTAVLFFQTFSGHLYSDKEAQFGKRDKAHHANKELKAKEFLDDPHNNIWTWAERHVEMQAKPFELAQVTKYVENILKKAEKAGYSQADVISAVIAGGIEMDALIAILEKDFIVSEEVVAE